MSFRRIGKETPVVVLAKQVIGPCWGWGFVNRNRLALREQRTHGRQDDQYHDGSHLCLPCHAVCGSASSIASSVCVLFLRYGVDLSDVSSRKTDNNGISLVGLVRR